MDERAKAIDRLKGITYEEVEKLGAVLGDPEYCAERVQALQEEFRMSEFICYFNQGELIDHAAVKRAMELFAQEVKPRCQ